MLTSTIFDTKPVAHCAETTASCASFPVFYVEQVTIDCMGMYIKMRDSALFLMAKVVAWSEYRSGVHNGDHSFEENGRFEARIVCDRCDNPCSRCEAGNDQNDAGVNCIARKCFKDLVSQFV